MMWDSGDPSSSSTQMVEGRNPMLGDNVKHGVATTYNNSDGDEMEAGGGTKEFEGENPMLVAAEYHHRKGAPPGDSGVGSSRGSSTGTGSSSRLSSFSWANPMRRSTSDGSRLSSFSWTNPMHNKTNKKNDNEEEGGGGIGFTPFRDDGEKNGATSMGSSGGCPCSKKLASGFFLAALLLVALDWFVIGAVLGTEDKKEAVCLRPEGCAFGGTCVEYDCLCTPMSDGLACDEDVDYCYSGLVVAEKTLLDSRGRGYPLNQFVVGPSLAATDIDMDGNMDLIAGAFDAQEDGLWATPGAVYLLLRSSATTHGGSSIQSVHKIGSSDIVGEGVPGLRNGDRFGWAVAGLGDFNNDGVGDIVVGAPYDNDGERAQTGAVYVVLLSKPDAASEKSVEDVSKISANMVGGPNANMLNAAGGQFGHSLAAIGDVNGDSIPDIAVGAIGDNWGATGAGAVYLIFLTAEAAAGGVGVKGSKKLHSGEIGAALGSEDHFGSSLALLGNVVDSDNTNIMVLAVGAPGDSSDEFVNRGAVYTIFVTTGGDDVSVSKWEKITPIIKEDAVDFLSSPSDVRFGTSVAGLGDLDKDGVDDLAVGSRYTSDFAGDDDRGAVHVVLLTEAGTVKGEQIIAGLKEQPSNNFFENFGGSLVGLVDEDDGYVELVVGSFQADSHGSITTLGVPPGFVSTCSLESGFVCKSGANQAECEPGGAVDVCKVANPCEYGSECISDPEDVLGSYEECKCIDYLSAGKHCDEVNACLAGDVLNEKEITSTDLMSGIGNLIPFGSSIAALSDLDGDGTGDIVLGGFYEDDESSSKRGAILLILREPDGSKSVKKIALTQVGGTEMTFDAFGWAVATLGYDDEAVHGILVGAPQASSAGTGEEHGAVYLMVLTDSGKIVSEKKISSTTSDGNMKSPLAAGDRFGEAVAVLGDFLDATADGLVVDVCAVGAPGDESGKGAVYILLVKNRGTMVKAEKKINSGGIVELVSGDRFGSSLAALDMDADGVNDWLAVGAPGDSAERGAVYILFLTKNGDMEGYKKISSVGGGGARFGASVATLGDLNRDGVVDIAVGAPGDDDGGNNRGAVFVLLLKDTGGVSAEQKLSSLEGGLEGPLADSQAFGSSVAGLGDLNGGGGKLARLAVGSVTLSSGSHSSRIVEVPPGFVMECESDHFCTSPGGTAKCEQCPPGQLRKGDDHKECEDINECDVGIDDPPSPCPNGGTCVNETPYFYCEDCPNGYAGRTCDLACADRHYLTSEDGRSCQVDTCYTGVYDEAKFGSRYADGGAGGFDYPHTEGPIMLGEHPANIGDLDGNGVADLAVGARHGNKRGSDYTGALYIIFRKEDGSVLKQTKIAPGMEGSEYLHPSGGMTAYVPKESGFGAHTALLGDLDGDTSTTQILVGTTGPRVPRGGGGKLSMMACVYLLSLNNATGKVVKEKKLVEDPVESYDEAPGTYWTQFGQSVVNLGDVDKDGTVDIAVGAPFYDLTPGNVDDEAPSSSKHGAVYIFFLDPNNSYEPKANHIRLVSNENGLSNIASSDQLGKSLAALGDLNEDGVPDMAVGTRNKVLILFLQEDGIVREQVDITYPGVYFRFGGALDSIGDWSVKGGGSMSGVVKNDANGDGVVDLIVGGSKENQPYRKDSVAVVVLLNRDGTAKGHRAIGEGLGGYQTGVSTDSNFGLRGVASLGDLNGDGVVELAIGASYEANWNNGVYTLGIGRYFVEPQTCDASVGEEVCPPSRSDGSGRLACTN